MRIASGRFQRGMKLKNIRTGRLMSVQASVFFLARERNLAEEAWPGDIIGIPNHGSLRIGDTLTESAALRITGIPSFAPERSCSGDGLPTRILPRHVVKSSCLT
jgi:peptide chain release factor 3